MFAKESSWIKHDLSNPQETSFCIVGGISKICLGGPSAFRVYDDEETGGNDFDDTIAKVARVMGFKGEDNDDIWDNLVRWNNSSDTTYKDFVACIDKAIKKLEA